MCHEPWLCQVWLIQHEYVMIDWHTINLIMLLCSVYVLSRVCTISAATGILSSAWGWSMSYMHGWRYTLYTLYRFAESWNTFHKFWQHPLYFSSRIVFRNPVFVQWRNENWNSVFQTSPPRPIVPTFRDWPWENCWRKLKSWSSV
jgi:hypothetical protein